MSLWRENLSSEVGGQVIFKPDPIELDYLQIPDEEHHPILREEVEAAVKELEMGKSAGVD